MVVNATGDVAYTAEFSGTFRHLSANASGFWLLTSDALHEAGPSGLNRQTEVEADGRMVVDYKGEAMVLGLTTLKPVDMSSASEE